MKKFLLIAICALSVCYGQTEPRVAFDNLRASWDLVDQHSYAEAIYNMTVLINDENTPNIDKVHYLIARSRYYSISMDRLSAANDINLLGELMRMYPECEAEKYKYYSLIPQD